jgi:hypothetical protein
VIGSRCGRFAPALARLPHVNVDQLISDQLSLDHAERALSDATKPGVLKVLLAR